jgi:hypothetical protein
VKSWSSAHRLANAQLPCFLLVRWSVYLIPKNAFFYPSPSNMTRYPGCHCSCRLVKLTACILCPLTSSSNISRASSSCQGNWRILYVPYVDCSLSINYICVRLTALWTTSGISLLEQIHHEGGFDVRNNTTKSRPAMGPLGLPATSYTELPTANQRSCHVCFRENGLGACLLPLQAN